MHPSKDGMPRRLAEVVGERAAPLVTVGGIGLVALAAAVAGAPPLLVVIVCTLPLVIGLGRQGTYPLLVCLLVARATLDTSGGSVVTIGIAVAITGLGMLALLSTSGVATPTALVVLVLFASAGAGAPSNGASNTYPEALRMVAGIAVVIIASQTSSRAGIDSIARSVQLIVLIPAVVAVYQYATGAGMLISGSMRAYGTLSHPNSAAMLFALANISTFVLVIRRRRGRWMNLALLALFLVAQAATGSIGGGGAMIAMVVMFLLAGSVRRADRLLLTAATLAVGAFVALSSDVATQRIDEFTNPQADKPTSLEWRFSAWADVLTAWRRHPVFGNGLGSTLARTIVPGNIPHNEYVRLLAEVGVVGFAAVLGLAVGVAVMFRRVARISREPVAAAFGLSVLAGTAINALASNTLLYSPSFYTTLFILGGCWRVLRQSTIPPPLPGGGTTRVLQLAGPPLTSAPVTDPVAVAGHRRQG